MRRLVTLIAGAVAGVLVTITGVYTVALLWPHLLGPPATSTAPAAANPTPLPTEEPPLLQTLGVSPTPTFALLAVAGTNDVGVLPTTRLSLQSPYEAQGFVFQLTELGDDSDHWVAASPDGLALVDIAGAEAVAQASVSVFGPIHLANADAGKRAIYMLTMMNAILPEWPEGAEWFAGELVNAARQSGDYESEITHQGVRVVFSVDTQAGALIMRFEPAQ